MGTPILKIRGSDGKIYPITAITGSDYTLPTAAENTLGGIKIGEGLKIDENGIVSVDTSSLSGGNTPAGGTSIDGYEMISSTVLESGINYVEWTNLSLRKLRLTIKFPVASVNADNIYFTVNGSRTGYISASFFSTSNPMVHSVTLERRGDIWLAQWLSIREIKTPQEYTKTFGISGWWQGETINSIKIETQTASSLMPPASKFFLEGIV